MKLFILFIIISLFHVPSLQAREVSLENKITSLYISFFNRAADKSGLDYWNSTGQNVVAQGGTAIETLKQLSTGFAGHPTFTATYGSMNNEEFVQAIYQNSLGRAGDAQGVAYWKGLLDSGKTRSDMVAEFMELSLTLDLTEENFPSLSESELYAAIQRQNLISNKVEAAVSFTKDLKYRTNVIDVQNPTDDPAYKASIRIISNIDEDPSYVEATTNYLNSISTHPDAIEKILEEWGLNSCVVNAIYRDATPSRSVCVDNMTNDECAALTYSTDTYDTNATVKEETCVSLGFSSESVNDEGVYIEEGIYIDETTDPGFIDWEDNATVVGVNINLPENSPLSMSDTKIEVAFNTYTPESSGDVSFKVPKDKITDAYIMIQDPSDDEYSIYMLTTILNGETVSGFSARDTAISLVLNGIDHELLTKSGTPSEVKNLIAQESGAFIQSFENTLVNDPYLLKVGNLSEVYSDVFFTEAVANSKEALEDLYEYNNQVILFSQTSENQLTVLPQDEIGDFSILPERKAYLHAFSGELTGDIVIENDTMLPIRYRATNLFTKMPIHTPKIGVFGDLISAQSGLLYAYNASSATVKNVNFNPSKVTLYTPGWAYLTYDTPEYDYIKSMNRNLNERLLLDNVVLVLGSLVPVGNKHIYLKMLQWISQQNFFRTALDEYYSSNGAPGDFKKAFNSVLKGLLTWDNLLELMQIPAQHYSSKPLNFVAEKAKWMAKIMSAEAGLWIYGAELAKLELDLFSTPAYIEFEQINFPVFLKYYDPSTPDDLQKVSTAEESRKVTLTGIGLYEDGADPTIELKAKNLNGEYQNYYLSGGDINKEDGLVWFDVPFGWLSTDSEIVGPIYFQYKTSFYDGYTGNQVEVTIPNDFTNDYYKVDIGISLAITGFSKDKITRSEDLTIYGEGFSFTNSDNLISFKDHKGNIVEVTPSYSAPDRLETTIPESLSHGPVGVGVVLQKTHQSNEKSISLIPKIVTASPTTATNVYDFEDKVEVSLSQEEGLEILYYTDFMDEENPAVYSSVLTFDKTTSLYPFVRVIVNGVNYDSSIVYAGYKYYKCNSNNEEYKDGECVLKEIPQADAWENWPSPQVCPMSYDTTYGPPFSIERYYWYRIGPSDYTNATCFYHVNQVLSSETIYIDEKRNGIFKSYDESGQLSQEIPYINNKVNGLQKRYYESGNIKELIPQIDSVVQGSYIEYYDYDSHPIYKEVPHVDGDLNGVEVTYYASGEVYSEVPYVNDEINGVVKLYTRSGCLYEEAIYSEGLRRSTEVYECE